MHRKRKEQITVSAVQQTEIAVRMLSFDLQEDDTEMFQSRSCSHYSLSVLLTEGDNLRSMHKAIHRRDSEIRGILHQFLKSEVESNFSFHYDVSFYSVFT